MPVLCVIPARLGSTRMSHKLLRPLGDKTVIEQTYFSATQCAAFDKVIVATDAEAILQRIQNCGGSAMMTDAGFRNGTERVAHAASHYPEYDIVVNLQGDEPGIPSHYFEQLLQPFGDNPICTMSTLAAPLAPELKHDPNTVKVICNQVQQAVLFTRAAAPFERQSPVHIPVYHHLGIYAFRASFLQYYASLEPTPLEITESLEQLRIIEHGHPIQVAFVEAPTVGIDTEQDLEAAGKILFPDQVTRTCP